MVSKVISIISLQRFQGAGVSLPGELDIQFVNALITSIAAFSTTASPGSDAKTAAMNIS